MVLRFPLDGNYDWLGNRLRYVGASEVATTSGVASYGSLAKLYCEKKGIIPPQIDNDALRRGRWGEPSVFKALAEERPQWEIVLSKIHVIDETRRIACTPDGFAIAPDRDGMGVIQAKVVARSIFKDKWLEDSDGPLDGPATVPMNFRMQTITERMLNADRCSWAVLAVLINAEFDWALRLFEIEPDPDIEDRIVSDVAAFYRDYFDPGIMPPFEPQADEELIKLLFPHDDGTEIDLSGDNRAMIAVEELTETSAALKRMRDRESELKTELTGKLGDHTYGRLADGRLLAWKTQHRKGYAVEPTTYRTLRVLKKVSA